MSWACFTLPAEYQLKHGVFRIITGSRGWLLTPKELNSKAQGRAAHPGLRGTDEFSTLKALHNSELRKECFLWCPFRAPTFFLLRNPGCAARPWALDRKST